MSFTKPFNFIREYKLFDEEVVKTFINLSGIILLYFILELILNTFRENEVIYLLNILSNFAFLCYFYFYFSDSKRNFIYYFFLLKYLSILFGIQWYLTQISNLFYYNSVFINIGIIFNYDLRFLNFVISFIMVFVDLSIFLLILNLYRKLLIRLKFNFIFDKNLWLLIKKNFSTIKNYASDKPFKIKLITLTLLTIIFITPIAYTQSMETIQQTNDGLFYLTKAIDILNKFFKNKSVLQDIISSGNDFLGLKNTLYFSGKNLQLAKDNFESLNSPLYLPLFLLLGLNHKKDQVLNIIGHLSSFLKGTMLDLVASIQDYLGLMNQLTNEILRRAYWWELEANNITYNPKLDFYNKFNNKITINLQTSVSKFIDDFFNLGFEINNSLLKDSSTAEVFFSQMNSISKILDQVVYLTKVAPPLLNATFFSVEVTNALAFDQFVTARNLTSLSQNYIHQSQQLLDNYSFDSSLSEAIADIGTVMNQFNQINNEFVSMTAGTENMFLSLSSSMQELNKTSFSNNNYYKNITLVNNIIKANITNVKAIVEKNIQIITQDINIKGNYIGFPFKSILEHFLWFYNGYNSAIDGYSSLWQATSETFNLYSTISNQQNTTSLLLNPYKKYLILPDLNISEFHQLYNNYTAIDQQVINTGIILNQSVTNGALKINTSIWDTALGYNSTENSPIATGFYQSIQNFFSFWNATVNEKNATIYFNNYDKYITSTDLLLNNITTFDIFITLSQQLGKN